jgi:hypothetical protein
MVWLIMNYYTMISDVDDPRNRGFATFHFIPSSWIEFEYIKFSVWQHDYNHLHLSKTLDSFESTNNNKWLCMYLTMIMEFKTIFGFRDKSQVNLKQPKVKC